MSMVTHRFYRNARGFTLLELMITVAIVGILAAIALPAYSDFVIRGKLSDGIAKLSDAKSKMDKYFFDNRQYTDAGGNCGVTFPAVASPDDYFLITCAATATTYALTATGVPANGMANTFVYRVNQANNKNSAGPGGKWTNAACWAVRKDGSCQ